MLKHHSRLRLHLTFTYVIGSILAVLLTYATFHILVQPGGISLQPAPANQNIPGDPEFLARLLIMALIVSLGLGYAIASGITRKLNNLAQAARRIADGDLDAHIPAAGGFPHDEIDELGLTFNEMTARLRESLEQQKKLEQARRDLVANVAHDLRTPLAAVRAAVEALEEGVVKDEATTTRYLAAVGQETRHLGRLIDDLFALSRLEAGQFELKLEPVYLEEILQDCLAGLLPQLERAGVALVVDLPATLPAARADRHAVQRVLTNLVQNALNFTPGGGTITVRGALASSGIELQISDSGPGIAPADLEPGMDGMPRIFDRFYRGDPTRSGSGAGLGLTIVKELVQAQGGRIWIKSEVGKGTTIGFVVPVP